MRPGCTGFFIGMVVLLSVVVNKLNVQGVAVLESENNPPVRADGHCPVPLEIAFERMQAIPWEVKSLGRRHGVKNGEDSFNRLHKIGADSAPVALIVEPFQASMLKAPNHWF